MITESTMLLIAAGLGQKVPPEVRAQEARGLVRLCSELLDRLGRGSAAQSEDEYRLMQIKADILMKWPMFSDLFSGASAEETADFLAFCRQPYFVADPLAGRDRIEQGARACAALLDAFCSAAPGEESAVPAAAVVTAPPAEARPPVPPATSQPEVVPPPVAEPPAAVGPEPENPEESPS